MSDTSPPGWPGPAASPSPTPSEPAWLADPTGRHQLRWWDGRAWTDEVADAGARAVDPLGPGPTAQPAAGQAWAPAAQPAAGAAGDGDGSPRRRAPILLLAGAAVAAVVAFVVFTGAGGPLDEGDDAGFGTFEGEVSADAIGRHEVSLGAGDVLLVTVTPDRDADVVAGLLLDGAGADHVDDLFGGVAEPTDAADALPGATGDAVAELTDGTDDPTVVWRTDLGFAGDTEVLLVVTARDLDGAVVVGPFDTSDVGPYSVELEGFTLELTEDQLAEASGEELLDAVLAHPEASASVSEVARDLLELLDEQAETES